MPCHSATDAQQPRTTTVTCRHSESNRALSLTMRACRAAGTVTASNGDRRSWRGPESNRPQPHCKCSSPPWYMPPQKQARSRRGSNSPSAVDSRESSPEDDGTKQSRVCEGNRTLTARFTDSHADHYTTHTMWITIVSREGVEPSSVAYRATALASVLTGPEPNRSILVRRRARNEITLRRGFPLRGPAVASQGIEPCACSVWN